MSAITTTNRAAGFANTALAQPAGSHGLSVIPRGRGDGFQATVRGHMFDLADPNSGHGLAPTPDDLFILSMASECAWSAQRFLRAAGLPDDVSVSATWRTRPADVSLTVTVSSPTGAVRDAVVSAFENSLAARSTAAPVVHISVQGVNP